MISFSDHYNALFIDRFSSKTKIGKDLSHFNNSLIEKNDCCSTTKNLLSDLETKRKNYPSTSEWWEYTKLKTMPEFSLETLQNRKTLEFPDLKRDYEIYTKRKIINLKSNP